MPYADPEKKKQYCREYYAKNREAQKRKRKEYVENNKEKVRLSKQKYYQDNKEKIRAHAQEFYSKPENKERRKATARIWREKNKDQINERQREYYKKYFADPKNRKRRQEYDKEYYADPKKKKLVKEYQKEWYLKNKEKKNAQAKANYEANKEAYYERSRRNKAKKPELYKQLRSAAAGRYRSRKKETVTDNHSIPELHIYWKSLDIDPKRCTYCDAWHTKWSNNWKTSQGDHVVPLDRGGTDLMNNLMPCCRSCNSKKGNRLLYSEWTPPNGEEGILC